MMLATSRIASLNITNEILEKFMLPSIRQLKYFLAAAEAGQISRAAVEMNVTQSSITLAIRDLENRLGYKLFHRRSQGVELTIAGEAFMRHAKGVLASLEELMTLGPEDGHLKEGTVRLGVTDTVSGYFLPGIWKVIKRKLPKLELRVTELPRRAVENGLAEGRFDLGIVLISNVNDKRTFETRPLLISERHLWISAGHQLAVSEKVSLTEIEDEPYLLLQTDDHERTMSRNWKRHGFSPNIIFRSHSIEAIRSLVAAGHGVTILSDLIYRTWSLEGQRILRKPLVEDIQTMDTGVIWSKESKLDPITEYLVQVLIGEADKETM